MTPATYFILAALQSEALHGYAIMQRAAELSQGRVRLATGTLYAALDRLTAANLITANGEEIVNGRGRRYYALTDDGRTALEGEAERLIAAARVVKTVRLQVGLA
jgi:PadR family transcriptional regulator PadR